VRPDACLAYDACMKRISALIGGAVLGVAVLAACGGGGGSSSTAPNSPVPPADTSAPVSAPQSFSASDAVAIPSAAPGDTSVPVRLPSDPSGASANAAFPTNASIPPDTTVAATYSTSADASAPALAARARQTASRNVRDGGATTSGIKPIAYLKLQFSADVSLPQAPAFSFVVPGTFTTNGVTYWLGLYDPLHEAAGWQKSFEGPATVSAAQTASGKTATKFDFASNGKPITFSANETYYLVLFAVGANAATPTPVPSSVPSNPPHDSKPAPVVASPANIQFPTVTTSSPVPLTFSQQGFTGPFQLHGDCTGIVNTNGASPTWTITPVGQGRCVIIGLGDRGASAVVHVGVVTPYETPRPQPSGSPEPTHPPTTAPTTSPSHSPEPTHAPTTAPTNEPTHPPTSAPTTSPSRSPEPTYPPTHAPTTAPTSAPSPEPSHSPGSNASPTPTPGSNPNG